jgi:hypothetical protein
VRHGKISHPMTDTGQSRRMRPACFQRRMSGAPRKRQAATKMRPVVQVEPRIGAVTWAIQLGLRPQA